MPVPGVAVASVSSTRPVLSTTAASTLVPPMSTPIDGITRSARVTGARQVCDADHAAGVAELRLAYLEHRSVAARGDVPLEAVPDRVEEQVPGLAHSAADHHHVGVEHGGERGHALTEPVAELGQPRDRERVAVLRGRRDQRTGDPGRVSPGPRDQSLRRLGVGARRARGTPRTRAVPRGVGLQAAEVAARRTGRRRAPS